MDDLRRIHYVAAHYRQLQGLRLLPLSLPFLLSSLWRIAGASPGALLPPAGWVLLILAAVAASFPIGRYYTRQFGHAEAPRWRTGAATLVGMAAVLLALAWLQERRPFPVSLPLLFLAIVLARLGLAAGRVRIHYLWIALACVVFALLPLLGAPAGVRTLLFDLLVGVGLIVAAVGDDRVLRRAMSPGAAGAAS